MSDSPSPRRFFSGATLERAILDAASHYGVEPERLAYERQEGGLARRGKTVIKVDPEAVTKPEERSTEAATPGPEPAGPAGAVAEEQEQEEAPAESGADETEGHAQEVGAEDDAGGDEDPEDEDEPEATAAGVVPDDEPRAGDEADETEDAAASERSEAEPAAEEVAALPEEGEIADLPRSAAEARRGWKEASGEVGVAARRWTESLLRLASLELSVQVFEREEELEIHLSGADAEVAIEDGGEVLRAMQHLLPRLMLSEVGDTVRCRVDCNDFREIHEETLRSRALEAATEALGDGGEITLDPMHPADRRIVHLALADNELVHTESLGRGFFKRVSIRAN